MVTKKTAKKSTAKKSTAKKSTAKKSTAKKSTAKKSTAKKSTAKKSTAKKSTAKSTKKLTQSQVNKLIDKTNKVNSNIASLLLELHAELRNYERVSQTLEKTSGVKILDKETKQRLRSMLK